MHEYTINDLSPGILQILEQQAFKKSMEFNDYIIEILQNCTQARSLSIRELPKTAD